MLLSFTVKKYRNRGTNAHELVPVAQMAPLLNEMKANAGSRKRLGPLPVAIVAGNVNAWKPLKRKKENSDCMLIPNDMSCMSRLVL